MVLKILERLTDVIFNLKLFTCFNDIAQCSLILKILKRQFWPKSIATLPPFGPIEGHKWFDQISSQWESQKNRFALIYFGKIQFLPPCIWDLPFMSYRLKRERLQEPACGPEPVFYTFMEPRNRFQEMNSASLCSLAGRYDNPISTRSLYPIDWLKMPALKYHTGSHLGVVNLPRFFLHTMRLGQRRKFTNDGERSQYRNCDASGPILRLSESFHGSKQNLYSYFSLQPDIQKI